MADLEQSPQETQDTPSEVEASHDENQDHEVSIEDRARELGWRPQEEFKGDKNKWRSAETFVELQPFFEKIDAQNKIIKALDSKFAHTAEETKRFMATVREGERKAAEAHYKQQYAALREEKRLALREGETDRAVDIDDQMAELRDQQKNVANTPQERIIPDMTEAEAKVTAFKARNSWYESNEDMQAWADAKAARLGKQGIQGDEVLARIEKEVKEVFPQQFRNSNRDKPSAVEGSSAAGNTSRSVANGLSDQEKSIMRTTLAATPGMTEAQWIKTYRTAQGGR